MVRASSLERTSRIDAEFFQKHYLAAAARMAAIPHDNVAALARVSDGNHFSISEDFVEDGVPYYRGQDVTGRFFVESAAPVHITRAAYERRYMRRSDLVQGDVLLSIVGTIGELSLVGSEQDATCSCKLAILRPNSISSEFLAVFLRSAYGQAQIKRFTRGAVQMGLILEDMDQLLVPTASVEFEARVRAVVASARDLRDEVTLCQHTAEEALLSAMGLADWAPPEPLAYVARALDASASGRLDARFFAPRIQALLDLLEVGGRRISDVAAPRREMFRANACEVFDYIEISDMDGAGAVSSTRLACDEAPSRATWYVRPDDIITSSVRPIRRLSAQITADQNGFVCSSGFVVVQPKEIAPEVLLTYLRLPVICELLDLYASASMYPAISDADIFNLPLPPIPQAVEDQIIESVRGGRAAKAQATRLLEAAKRAVEIAIEDGEPAALAYLGQFEGAV